MVKWQEQYSGGLALVYWRTRFDYNGGYTVRWRANISTMEAQHQCDGGITSGLLRLFITVDC